MPHNLWIKKLWASKNGQKYTNQLPLIFDSDFFDNYNFQIGKKNNGVLNICYWILNKIIFMSINE